MTTLSFHQPVADPCGQRLRIEDPAAPDALLDLVFGQDDRENVLIRILVLRMLPVNKLGEVDVNTFLAVARRADDRREKAETLHVITGLL